MRRFPAWHRVEQFFDVLWAPFRSVDEVYVRDRLAEYSQRLPDDGARDRVDALLALFRAMPRAEQLHGIAVCQNLEQQGVQDLDLLTAALFHDTGKTLMPLALWERVWVVLIEYYFPRWADRWGAGMSGGLRRGFVVRQRHAAWGAEMMTEMSVSAKTAALIRWHHDHDMAADDPLLAALQAADEV